MDTRIIKNPRITEKGSGAAEQNVYVFDIADSANKTEIKKAILILYKVKPIRVNIAKVPRKNISMRGKVGFKSGGRKAFVYLKKEDKIEFV
jgi:large subunit ribosomal protein L23